MPKPFEPTPRLLAARVRVALRDTVVLIHGTRQSGKTTLARVVGEPLGFKYLSFDSGATLDFAREARRVRGRAPGAGDSGRGSAGAAAVHVY